MSRARNPLRLSSPRAVSRDSQASAGIEIVPLTTFSPGVMGFLPAPALAPPCWFSLLTAPNKAPSS